MLLRRITEHIKAQNWTAVVLDFLIVVVGVFIGIQVSNWNDVRVNREIGEGYKQRLIAELENESKTWSYFLKYTNTTNAHAISALAGFQQDPNSLDINFLTDLYQASQHWNAPMLRGTFDELLSTGRIETVADEEARLILSNHYGRQSTVLTTQNERTDYRRIVREMMDQRVQSEIRSHCDDRYISDERNFIVIELPEQCEIELPVDLVKAEIARLHGSDEIQRSLRFHKSTLNGKLGSLQTSIGSAQTTLEALTGSQ